MPTDELVLGSRSLLNHLIIGGVGFDGLQARLDTVFASEPANKRPKAQLRYTYDAGRQGIVLIQAPLERPLVTLITTLRTKQSFYKHDRHPTLDDTYAWARRFSMQWDVWGRTPVEVEAISDAIEREVPKMHEQLWSLERVALQMDTFEDAPLEEETGIFRSMAIGYVQTAQTSSGS